MAVLNLKKSVKFREVFLKKNLKIFKIIKSPLRAFKNSELKSSILQQSRQDLIFRGLEIIFAVSEFANRAGAAFLSFRLGHLKKQNYKKKIYF